MPAVDLSRLQPNPARVPVLDAAAAMREPAAPADRPRIALNMVASLDGHATYEGRTKGLGSQADHELFHALREHADAVMAGAGTVRVERYGPMLRKEERRQRRRERGLPEQPLAVIVSGSLDLSPDIPLLADPDSEVAIVTSGDREVAGAAARIEYLRDGLPAGLRHLRQERGIEYLLCEGGPTLNRSLLGEDLVDELFLAISPKLLGGSDPLTIVDGGSLPEPAELRLVSAHEGSGDIFLRYEIVR